MHFEESTKICYSSSRWDLTTEEIWQGAPLKTHAQVLYIIMEYKVIFTTGSDWTQQVVLENGKSKTVTVQSGVPQDSVLGAILFLQYINNLPD